MAFVVILPFEINHALNGIKSHDGHKLNLVLLVQPQQLYTSITLNLFGFNAGEYLLMQQILVEVRILESSPAVPYSFYRHDEVVLVKLKINHWGMISKNILTTFIP